MIDKTIYSLYNEIDNYTGSDFYEYYYSLCN